jgi:hypothetical protein
VAFFVSAAHKADANVKRVSQPSSLPWSIVGSGHTRDLRDRFLNGWFRWFFEINAQFEILPGKTR